MKMTGLSLGGYSDEQPEYWAMVRHIGNWPNVLKMAWPMLDAMKKQTLPIQYWHMMRRDLACQWLDRSGTMNR